MRVCSVLGRVGGRVGGMLGHVRVGDGGMIRRVRGSVGGVEAVAAACRLNVRSIAVAASAVPSFFRNTYS